MCCVRLMFIVGSGRLWLIAVSVFRFVRVARIVGLQLRRAEEELWSRPGLPSIVDEQARSEEGLHRFQRERLRLDDVCFMLLLIEGPQHQHGFVLPPLLGILGLSLGFKHIPDLLVGHLVRAVGPAEVLRVERWFHLMVALLRESLLALLQPAKCRLRGLDGADGVGAERATYDDQHPNASQQTVGRVLPCAEGGIQGVVIRRGMVVVAKEVRAAFDHPKADAPVEAQPLRHRDRHRDRMVRAGTWIPCATGKDKGQTCAA